MEPWEKVGRELIWRKSADSSAISPGCPYPLFISGLDMLGVSSRRPTKIGCSPHSPTRLCARDFVGTHPESAKWIADAVRQREWVRSGMDGAVGQGMNAVARALAAPCGLPAPTWGLGRLAPHPAVVWGDPSRWAALDAVLGALEHGSEDTWARSAIFEPRGAINPAREIPEPITSAARPSSLRR